jgi:hypothetical protein
MFPEDLTNLGIGAMVAIVILREVFSFLNGRKSDRALGRSEIENSILIKGIFDDSEKCREDISWLRSVHDQKDEDGVYIWYLQASMKRDVHKLTDTVSKLGSSIEKVFDVQRRQMDTMERMVKLIDKN